MRYSPIYMTGDTDNIYQIMTDGVNVYNRQVPHLLKAEEWFPFDILNMDTVI